MGPSQPLTCCCLGDIRAPFIPGPPPCCRCARGGRDQRPDLIRSAGNAPGTSGSALSSGQAAARASRAPREGGRVGPGLALLVSAAAPWPGDVQSHLLMRRLGLSRSPRCRGLSSRAEGAAAPAGRGWSPAVLLLGRRWGSRILCCRLLRRNARESVRNGWPGEAAETANSQREAIWPPAIFHRPLALGTAQRVPLVEQQRQQPQCCAARLSLRRQRTHARGPEHLLGIRGAGEEFPSKHAEARGQAPRGSSVQEGFP